VEPELNIVLVDANPVRAQILEDGLREAGHRNVRRLQSTPDLLARLTQLNPDVVVIDLENPSRDVLEQMFQVSRAVRRPVAMFVDQTDAAGIQAAVDAGVSAYVVGGLQKERIKHILDTSVLRFRAYARLQHELEDAKTALEEHKLIDRAKGILMRTKNLSEDDSYALMRRSAMNERRRISEIAQAIVMMADILK
jgi:response regulator NasT